MVDPLFRHAYTLIVNTGLTSALGLLYWVLVGRLYSPADVGRNAAAISSIVFLAGLAQLNLRPVLSRFLPITGNATARFILLAYGSAGVVAVASGFVFLLSSSQWATNGPIPAIRDDAGSAALFIAATVLWTIFALQDGVLIGLRATISLTVENTLFGIAKIVIVVALAVLIAPPAYAITASWLGPMIIAVVAVNLLIFRRLIPAHVRASSRTDRLVSPSRIVRFALGDYVGSLFELSYVALLPVIVIDRVGPVAAAQFYIVWVIASSLEFIPTQMVTSLVVDTAGDPASFRHQGRRMLIGMARVLVPICLVIVVGAPLILRVFGPSYEGATSLLQLLVLSVIPYSINILYLGLARIRVNGPRIITVQTAVASMILSLSFILIPRIGLDGVGVAFLVGRGVVAAVLLVTAVRPLLTKEPISPIGGRAVPSADGPISHGPDRSTLAGSESESDVRPTDGGRSRIHITGGSGAGKSSLARSIGARFGLPVYHLDDVPRDRGSGRVRALDERLEIVQSIATSSAWVTEGVHAEWTDELVRRADLIIWLDQLEGRTALLRVFRRFVGDGLAEARRRRGLQRFTRIRSYVYQLGQFIRFVGEVQAFHGDGARAKAAEGGSRAATIAQLQPYSAKVIHCRTQADVDNVTAAYGTSRSGSRSPGARGRPGFIARVTTFRRQYPRGGALFFTRRVNRTAGAALAVLLFSTRVSPNAVSVAGLIVHFVTAVLVATASSPIPPPTWIVVLLLWQLAFSLDCADGQLARARGTATPFGAWLDIFFDVITHVMVYGALVVYVVRALDIEGVEASALTTSVMGAHLFQAFTSWERGVIGTAPAIAEPHGLFAVAMHARHLLDYGWFLFAAAILLPFPYLLVGFLIFSAAIHALSAIAQLALNWRYQVVADESPPR